MSQTVAIPEPHLFGRQRAVLEQALAGSKRYLEFGAGGSTLLAARLGVPTIVAVDSDAQWVAAVREHAELAPRILDGSISVLHGDIGPTRDWGFPAGEEHKAKWPRYLEVAWVEWTRRGTLPDLVFVDGRFRVACCLSVVVAVGGAAATTVLLHDMFDQRPDYRDVLEFFEPIRIEGSLYWMRIRADATPTAALARLLWRQFDPR